MCKIRLSLTIFGQFLEGNLNFDHIWTAQFHFDHICRPNMFKVQISLQMPSKYGQSKPIFEHFFGFTFFPCWWASGRSLWFRRFYGGFLERSAGRPGWPRRDLQEYGRDDRSNWPKSVRSKWHINLSDIIWHLQGRTKPWVIGSVAPFFKVPLVR